MRRRRQADRPVADRVQPAALPADQRRPGGQQGADPGPGVELRLRRRRADRRVLCVLPAPQDRQVGPAVDPHRPGRRVRAAAAPRWTEAPAEAAASRSGPGVTQLDACGCRHGAWPASRRSGRGRAAGRLVAATAGVLLLRSYLDAAGGRAARAAGAGPTKPARRRSAAGSASCASAHGFGPDLPSVRLRVRRHASAMDTAARGHRTPPTSAGPDSAAGTCRTPGPRRRTPWTVPDGARWRVHGRTLGRTGFIGVAGVSLREVEETADQAARDRQRRGRLLVLMLGSASPPRAWSGSGCAR